MKNIIFFLLFASAIQAQTTSTTYVLQPDGVTYFEVVTVTQDDGRFSTTGGPIGPKSAITNDQADKILAKTASLAQSAYTVSYTRRTLSEVASSDSLITAVSGASALKAIQDRYQTALLTPGWTIDQGTGFQPLVFTVNGAGTLKYSINGAATKNATIYGSIIRLASFPSAGNNTDFFIDESGKKYFSLPNRGVIIKLP